MIGILYIISRLLSALSLLSIIGCLVLLTLTVTSNSPNNWDIHFDIPIQLEIIDKFYPLEYDDAEYQKMEIQVERANLELIPTTQRGWWQILGYIHAVLYIFFYFFIFRNLSKILRNIKDGNPFSRNNYHHLRNIGLIVLGLVAYLLIFGIVSGSIGSGIIEELHLQNINSSNSIEIEAGSLFFGLLILILAEVFKAGNHLKELEEQTV